MIIHEAMIENINILMQCHKNVVTLNFQPLFKSTEMLKQGTEYDYKES